ncbi:zinc ribbon domain-containing protein [Pseudoflavonifractor phocaeensis]|uniref:DUF6320 domain-containing protein n=1 Tax=Pseudoflavonifractor phocaeensis TaxID=1870988 RepID=UPI00195F0FC3|nr:DUF6320 domain-containing protein [Pseudoflavonifractor phocaeensis]MBM6870919.1 zinc ribbon domain-containing protein [Pseudoflavonifractor phocaeensis]MBM6937890.1 zinc ribbon domain-containing protein [Pseudoflavonifractor phocaeensis]
MSYCVNCGVELDDTAAVCPLCQTPVCNPSCPVDLESPKPFPVERSEVPPVSRVAVALLLSSMFLSVALVCGLLNLFLRTEHAWSLYVIGAAAMLWVWVVPPLLARQLSLLVRLLLDVTAIAVYIYLIALDLNGMDWYWGLALPVILLGGACVLVLSILLDEGRRSILSSVTLIIGTGGIFSVGVEYFIDQFLNHQWQPAWSLVVLAICVALIIPLIVVRRVPYLREEVRRRFHM